MTELPARLLGIRARDKHFRLAGRQQAFGDLHDRRGRFTRTKNHFAKTASARAIHVRLMLLRTRMLQRQQPLRQFAPPDRTAFCLSDPHIDFNLRVAIHPNTLKGEF